MEVLIIAYGIHLFIKKTISIYLCFSRATAIQNHFTKVSYFHAWNDMWSPINEKNAYALYNNPHVVNRDQI
jgi:hypothetical protein